MNPPVLVELVRSGMVESVHRGSVLALDADGAPALTLGDVTSPVLPRSSNKPLQAVALLEAGWQPGDDEQLALAAASHSGEPRQLEVVRRLLASAGLDEAALQCPPLLPLSEAAAHGLLRSGGAASRLTMNCSGKHAAMLACCVANGWPTTDYLSPASPVQRATTQTLGRLAGEPVAHVAIDGCGAPQHALSLFGLARAFRALATEPGPCDRVAAAMRAHPELVGGAGRDVTEVMQGVPGLVAKDGAEGVYAAALPSGAAVAVKVADGATRAAVLLLVVGLRALGVTGDVLDRLGSAPVLGGGAVVGELRVHATLPGAGSHA